MKRGLIISMLFVVVCCVYGQTTAVSVSGTQIQKEKVFDHTLTAAVINHGTLSGVAAGDTVTVTATATYDTEDADSNKVITVTFALGGPDAASYSINDTIIYNDGIINKRQLYRDSIILASKIYDGSDTCHMIFSGVARNYVTHHILTTIDSVKFEDANVGVNKPVYIWFGLDGEDVDNYLAPRDTVLYSSISRRVPLILGTKVNPKKTYDGTVDVEVTAVGQMKNLAPYAEDSVTFRIASAEYDTKDVGKSKSINVYYALEGPDTANYEVPQHIYFLNGEIKPVQLEASGGSVECTKDYDGTTHAVVNTPSQPVGVVAGEQVYMNTSADFEDDSVGKGKIVYFWYTLYGKDMANYTAPEDSVVCRDGEIRKAATPVVTAKAEVKEAIYPNPAKEWVKIDAESVVIYSLTGMRVYEGAGGRIDVRGLANGVYIVRRTLANGEKTKGEKLIICK